MKNLYNFKNFSYPTRSTMIRIEMVKEIFSSDELFYVKRHKITCQFWIQKVQQQWRWIQT